MASTVGRVALALITAASLATATVWLISENTEPRLSTAELGRGTHLRPPIPVPILRFSCNRGNILIGEQFKWIREDDWKVAVAVEPACMPDGDFVFSVPATAEEFRIVTQTPMVKFVITRNGAARDVTILRSSGSNDLDTTISRSIATRRFGSNQCGECRVETTVNVEF